MGRVPAECCAREKYTGAMILGVAFYSVVAAVMVVTPERTMLSYGAWVCGAIAMAAYVLAAWHATRDAKGNEFSRQAMIVAWSTHGLSLALDMIVPGEGARFGFAPALSVTLWMVVAAHAAERHSHSLLVARRNLCLLCVGVVALALVYPGITRSAGSPWAPLHWLLGLVSYGLVGAAVVHALMLDRAERKLREPLTASPEGRRPSSGLPLMTLERLTFRFVDAGFLVLTLALLMGTWFALQLSGWRWDHKTVFSLLGWVVMALLVAGRHLRGWRGPRATRWIYAGAVLLLLAYVGSRFVFEVFLGRTH